MALHTLPKLKGSNAHGRRLGRGRRSTKGKTSGHGVKGQSVRNRLKLRRLQQFKRLPFMRGKSSRRVNWSVRPVGVNLTRCVMLNVDRIDADILMKAGIITLPTQAVKILGTGTLDKKLTFSSTFLFTRSAKEKIEKAGGTIEE